MSKLDPIDEFVRKQLASGRYPDYEALVRYALANLKDRQSEIDEIAEELRPSIYSEHPRLPNCRRQRLNPSDRWSETEISEAKIGANRRLFWPFVR